MQTWHITVASEGRLAFFLDDPALREGVRTLVRVLRVWLLLFCVVDEHVHVVVSCDRERAGILASALGRALAHRTEAPLAPARIRPVSGRSHLENLVGYVARQPAHHGLPGPAALYEGSCVPDLLGARWLEDFDATRIQRALPRYDIAAALTREGFPTPAPAPPELIRDAGASRLVAAACAALAVDDLTGREPTAVYGRAIVSRLAKEARIASAELAHVGLAPRARLRLAAVDVPADAVRAVRVRIALEDAVTHSPTLGRASPAPTAGKDGRSVGDDRSWVEPRPQPRSQRGG